MEFPRVGEDTLVIYMGMGDIREIAQRLIDAGRNFEELTASVERATLPESGVSYHSLGAIAFEGAASDVRPPCLIIIGQTVSTDVTAPRAFPTSPLFRKHASRVYRKHD